MPNILSLLNAHRLRSDEELYFLTKRGDIRAFDILYARYERKLLRFIYGYLKTQQASEDVFHDAFLSLLDSKEVTFDTGNFQAWIYRISKNLCLNVLRKDSKHEALGLNLIPDETDNDPEALLIKKLDNQTLQIALKTLPIEQSQVLNLRLAGLQYQEISNALDIPVGTVKSRFFSLVRTVREILVSEAN